MRRGEHSIRAYIEFCVNAKCVEYGANNGLQKTNYKFHTEFW